jgi:hypothetical protein
LRAYGKHPLRAVKIEEVVAIGIVNEQTGGWGDDRVALRSGESRYKKTLIVGVQLQHCRRIGRSRADAHVILSIG